MSLDSDTGSLSAASVPKRITPPDQAQVESDSLLDDDGKDMIQGVSQSIHDELGSPFRYHHLPPEILLVIFRIALPPPAFLSPRTNTLFIGQKKAFLLVCRSWHDAAVEILFEEVYLRGLISFLRFINTLEESGQGHHVKSLTIDTVIPPYDSDTDFRISLILDRTARLCTNLSNLSLSLKEDRDRNSFSQLFEHFNIPSALNVPVPLAPDISHLRELHIGINALRFLSGHPGMLAQTLEVLALHFGAPKMILYSHMEWPRLKWLRCIFPEKAYGIHPLVQHFEMPQLERLTIVADFPMKFSGGGRRADINQAVFPLVRAHKERLVYICLVGINPENDGLQTLFGMAPRLRHLVIDSDMIGRHGLLPAHRKLQHIDVWCRCTGVPGDERTEELKGPEDLLTIPERSEETPSLKSVRIFDRGLIFTSASVDLPAVISPEDWTTTNGNIQYPGLFDIGVACSGKVVYRNDLWYTDKRWDWGNVLHSYREEEEDRSGDSYDRSSRSDSVSSIPWYYRGWARDRDGILDDSDGDVDYIPDDGSSTHSADEYDSGSEESFFLEGFGGRHS
ncbi:hypothetical protein V5O48_012974 [Marasmius crinis-equi]|uniref:F-box domain-containing protein n=1 Tax=Marasmius crinis-equi TaxID=585013 RepID=A0ABR3F1M6_9AGAR